MRKFFANELKIIAVSLSVGLLFALMVAGYTYSYALRTQANIAENVVRFHVRANSDCPADQELKDQIRAEVLAEFEHYFTADTVEKARYTLSAKLPRIQDFAQEVARQKGSPHEVTASFTRQFFPTQFYGNIAFPPGEYDAVQIIIGEGMGSNWWCLMFPPLCYVDMTSTENGRQILSETVGGDGFRLINHQEEEDQSWAVRFRVVEWWQNRRQPTPRLQPSIANATEKHD